MIISNIKFFIKRLIPNKIKFHITNLSRILDVFLMMVTLNIWPEQTYRFSTRKFLPPKKNRHFKSPEFIIPYKLIKSKTNLINKMDEIFVIGLGSSFDLNELKKINKPIFLLSFWNILKIDNKNNIIYSSEEGGYGHSKNHNSFDSLKEYKNDNLTYVMSNHKLIEKFKSRGNKVIGVNTYIEDENENYFPLDKVWGKSSFLDMFNDEKCKRVSLVENIIKQPILPPYPKWSQTGSVLPFLCALSFFSNKINVYGWDFFLDSSPNDMSHFELMLNMYKNKADINRSRTHFEEALVNFYYAYKLSQIPKFKIHGNLGKLSNHKKLIKKIEKVFFI